MEFTITDDVNWSAKNNTLKDAYIQQIFAVFTNGQNGQKVCRPIIETIFQTKLSAFDNI